MPVFLILISSLISFSLGIKLTKLGAVLAYLAVLVLLTYIVRMQKCAT